jgi:hypothetical protein
MAWAPCLAESLRGNRVARRPPFSQERLLQAKIEPTPIRFESKSRSVRIRGICIIAGSTNGEVDHDDDGTEKSKDS